MITKVKNILEKYKTSDKASSLMLAFTQSLIAAIFIFIDFVFSKKLDTTQFGSWKQMFFFVNLMVPILSFGIPEGYNYYIAKEGKRDVFFSNAFFMFIFSGILGISIIIILNFLHAFQLVNLNEYYLVSILFPIGFIVFNLNKSLRYSYINASRVWSNTKILSLFFIPTILIILFFSTFIEEFLDYYLWIGLLIYLLIFGLPLVSLIKNLHIKISFSYFKVGEIKKMLRLGIPLYLATFIGFMVINTDKGIVSIFEDKATFAIFSVGAIEIPLFAMLSAAFSQQIYPKLVRLVNENKKEEAKELWIKTTIQVSYITYPMILILMIFAKPILFFIYSDLYGESIVLFQIYLLVGLMRNNYYGALITASGHTKYITFYSLLTLITNLVLSLILYFIYGLSGIIYGSVFSTLIIDILQLKHEGLLNMYLKKFILNKYIFILITLILISFLHYDQIFELF